MDQDENCLAINQTVNKRYKVQFHLGSGSFGVLHTAIDKKTREFVAIKVEKKNIKSSQLEQEYLIYQKLHKNRRNQSCSIVQQLIDTESSTTSTSVRSLKSVNSLSSLNSINTNVSSSPSSRLNKIKVPKVFWFGEIDGRKAMVMQLLGANLEELFVICRRKFTLKTVLMIGDRLLLQLENFHRNGYLHRDLKPDNFVCGNGDEHSNIYIVDYGLAKQFRDSDGNHIPLEHFHEREMEGTARYCSINAHFSIPMSRRDDLESLGYILIYFMMGGQLPWMGLKKDKVTKAKHANICKKKMTTTLQQLCDGLEPEFLSYMQYCRSMKYDQEPEYSYLRNLFAKLAHRKSFIYDWNYDWMTISQ